MNVASKKEAEERLRSSLADSYTIEREIGSGGMATVYLAQDLKHDRKVAVKVLKPELGAVMGSDRFLAEIRTTAKLSHPHILPLHDSGEADGLLFYVMPLVEGENLRQRLDREGQLQVEESLRIAARVSDALDHAHRHGVIHRDLKPANILFQDGEPVVADFGIALAVSAAGEGRLTETGLSLGTPYYMSPEQASGGQIPTAASDVYSLGCVLYEMLTGDPPHTGSSAQAVLGKILLGEITRPTKLRRTIPANVEGAILKALERLPADRFESATGFAAALADRQFRHGIGAATTGERIPWKPLALSFGLASVLLAGVLGGVLLTRSEESPEVARFGINLPEGQDLVSVTGREMTISPDGRGIVYTGPSEVSNAQLWHRPVGQLNPRPIPGTDGASNPVFSPDGLHIAFITLNGDLKTVPLVGGQAVTVVPLTASRYGLDWGSDGMLYFTNQEGEIQAVSGSGGDPITLTGPEIPGRKWWPAALPDGKGVLFSSRGGPEGSQIAVISADGGPVKLLFPGSGAVYAPSGHILYQSSDSILMARPFDVNRMEDVGPARHVLSGIRVGGLASPEFALSTTGSLIYRRSLGAGSRELVWVNRDGSVRPFDPEWTGSFFFPALSEDGRQLAVEIAEGGQENIWVSDLVRGTRGKLTFEGGRRPAWTPDGGSVTFYSMRTGTSDLWTRRADGTGAAVITAQGDRSLVEAQWSHDGVWIIGRTHHAEPGNGDIVGWRVGIDSVPLPLVATEFGELQPALSPDGRFLAYSSGVSGLRQVFVVPFPNTQDYRVTVSRGEGIEPVWAKDGRELFYRRGVSGDLVAVEIQTSDTFQVGEERALFPAAPYLAHLQHPQYDVSPDGERFLMVRTLREGHSQLIWVRNFSVELKEGAGG
jgi:serine/threonine-protein kinase